jgi:hypothetical protein
LIDEENVTENETPDAPVTEAAPEAAPETTPKDPYDGKSADDLKAMLKDAQKQIGKQSTEVGEVRRLREEMESLKQAVTRPQFDPGVYYPPQPAPEEEFDYANPKASVEKLVEKRLNAERQQYLMRQAQENARDAQAGFENAKKVAYRDNPELFKGIERDVEGQLFQAWKMGAADKRMLGDPQTFVAAATLVRLNNGTLGEVYQSRKTVTAPKMETPNSRRSADEGDSVVLGRSARKFMEESGMTEKEALEALGVGDKMADSGELIWAGRR